ncbi:sulfotransferase family protein [Hyphomonas adhaerens]|uniref:sulfotransferase family protein n=1 Tax=Hyphomonas adhaerens TaxID=81029 RepID=UPI0023552E58|nr:sulfotransferase family protein [Hyphomonas adhaerens]
MTLKVISAGFGRTGTMSLKLALEQLGLGPCHHMIEVIENGEKQVPLWNDVLDGKPDFDAIYDGYNSAVDWPSAAFWKDLADYYPDAKIILSSRSAESWYGSISETILAAVWAPENWPPQAVEWFTMVSKVLERSFDGAKTKEELIEVFNAHEAAVKAAIPADRLLVHSAKDGWDPLCAFLGMPVPEGDYPRTNSKEEFFQHMTKADDL